MSYDYIIANCRIRFDGSESDPQNYGLHNFAPFTAKYDPSAEIVAEIGAALDIDTADTDSTLLMQFAFDNDIAVCKFYRASYGYLFTIDNGRDPIIKFTYDTASSSIRSNYGVLPAPSPSFIRFGLWIMTAIAVAPHHTAPVHSSTLIHDNCAVLFLGESGTGKSTHTRLWRENIAGTTLLNDDSPFIGFIDGTLTAFGSPWSGKTSCYKNENYPVRAIVRLRQAPYNAIRRIKGAAAIGALLPSLPPAFAFEARLEDMMINILSATVASTPIYQLDCLPDADAALTAHNAIFGE